MNITAFDIFQNHFKIILPEFFFVSSIFIILIYGTLYNASAFYKYPILTNLIGWLSIQTLLITLFLIINCPYTGTVVIFNNVLIMDDFTMFAKIIILIGAISTILVSFKYTLNQKLSARANEYMVLILFSTLSMLLIIASFDLISMYLAIELQSLAFYVLAAFQRNSEFSTEAGLKYFILGAISSGLLLFGESIIYGYTGITNFEELARLNCLSPATEALYQEQIPFITTNLGGLFFYWSFTETVSLGLTFILIAFLFKISAVPFHLWTPDVYEGAPTTVTAFFAITPKIAIIALLLRLCMYTFYDLIESWQYTATICAFLSMFIGTLGAIQQNKIKRLFAYSSIAHVGYLLISLATGTIESIEALLIYAVLYTLTVINIFCIVLILSRENFDVEVGVKHPPQTVWFRVGTTMHSNSVALTECSGLSGTTTYTLPLNNQNIQQNNLMEDKYQIICKKLPSNLSFKSSGVMTLKEPYQKFKGHFANLIEGNPIWNPYQTLKQTNFFHHERANEKKPCCVSHTTDLSTLSKTNPILAFSAAIIFFSNAGIPPLAGFYGKLNVFLAAVENSMYFLALVGILCSVMGAFYSIRLIKIIYYHSMSENHWPLYQSISKENSIVLALTFFFTLFFFLSPSFLFLTAHSAALSLCI